MAKGAQQASCKYKAIDYLEAHLKAIEEGHGSTRNA